jgi:cytochrome b561
MKYKNTSNIYGFVSKNFHWIMTVLIICNFVLGIFLDDLEKGPVRFLLFSIHKSTGIVVLMLLILRFFWRIVNTTPAPLGRVKFLNILSKLGHYFFYFILLVVTLSGWTYSSAKGGPVSVFGLFSVPALVEKNNEIAKIALNIHVISVYAFIAVLSLHVLMSLVHHYILKDKTLSRIWYGNSN